MANFFKILIKPTIPQTQENLTLNRINIKKTTERHTTSKPVSDKEKKMKAVR